MASRAKQIHAYTDGACEGNPGPGGYGVVYFTPEKGNEGRELIGAHPRTTNNQMELMAAIALLETLPQGSHVALHTDSRYVQDGITQWLPNWKRRNWKLKSGGAVKNAGLWRRLERAAARHHVDWRWVRGHAGNDGNERADRLARNAIQKLQRGEIEPVDLQEAPTEGEVDKPSASTTAPPAAPSTQRKQAPKSTRNERNLFNDAPAAEQPAPAAAARLVLASTSPYRREQLARLGLEFTTAPPGIDEEEVQQQRQQQPVELVRTLARLKAEALAGQFPGAVLLGGDQAVMHGNKLFGKPATRTKAVEQLLELAGGTHHLLTAIALHDTRDGRTYEHLDIHEMTMRPLTRKMAQRYVARDESEDCAGAYKIEALGIALFERIHGEDATAITGLPLIWLCDTLTKLGLDPLG